MPAGIVVDALSVVVNGTSGLTTIEKDAGGLLVGVRTSVAGHAVAVRFDVHAESSTSARVQAAGHAPRVVIGVDPDRARVVIDEVFDRLEKWSESASL